MTMKLARIKTLILSVGCAVSLGCGAGDEPTGLDFHFDRYDDVGCNELPSCWTDAIQAVSACVSESQLELSGGVQNPVCTGAISRANPNSIAPTSVTFYDTSGAEIQACGELLNTSGELSFEGEVYPFERYQVRDQLGGGDDLTIEVYESGDVGIECGDQKLRGSVDDLSACGDQLLLPEFTVVGDGAMATSIAMSLRALGTETGTQLFSCDGLAE